jgi:glutamyl-tRNA synthetase
MSKVRVRFAPSPTGPLHIGGVRTALFNYLFAKKHGGDFLLRIEDTDQTRYVPGAEQYIMDSLKWCGLPYSEGPDVGGAFGPYRQSERKAIYKQYADQLLTGGNAYYAFDTAEELDKLRLEHESNKQVFVYNFESRKHLRNSLTLSETEVKALIDANVHYVIRFKMPENFDVVMHDEIRGQVTFNTKELDDKVLYKSDGLPTYHLANVVDDHLMEISHVIRGEEWLSSMPLHVLLYKAFDWQATMPKFAHLPLILKPVGQGKLSKRDGDKMGFPVFPLRWVAENGEESSGYRESGYFPEAVINMLALLGWNPGIDQEIFTIDELIQLFSLERVGKSGSKFDPEKTKWFNHQYITHYQDQIVAKLEEELIAKGYDSSNSVKNNKIVSLIKERLVLLNDVWSQSSYFFEAPTSYDAVVIKKRWKAEIPIALTEIATLFQNADDFSSSVLQDMIKDFIGAKQLNPAEVFNCIRLCLVGGSFGAHIFDIAEIIGKEETVARIHKAVKEIVL